MYARGAADMKRTRPDGAPLDRRFRVDYYFTSRWTSIVLS